MFQYGSSFGGLGVGVEVEVEAKRDLRRVREVALGLVVGGVGGFVGLPIEAVSGYDLKLVGAVKLMTGLYAGFLLRY